MILQAIRSKNGVQLQIDLGLTLFKTILSRKKNQAETLTTRHFLNVSTRNHKRRTARGIICPSMTCPGGGGATPSCPGWGSNLWYPFLGLGSLTWDWGPPPMTGVPSACDWGPLPMTGVPPAWDWSNSPGTGVPPTHLGQWYPLPGTGVPYLKGYRTSYWSTSPPPERTWDQWLEVFCYGDGLTPLTPQMLTDRHLQKYNFPSYSVRGW